MKRWKVIGLGLALLIFAACSSGPPGGDGPPGESIAKYLLLDDTPAIELDNGKVVLLERLDEWEALREQFPLPDEEAPSDLTTLQTLPSRVDLRANQTPIKDQGGRGTCVAFATAAALEAAYRRERGLTLNLSEQYANHIQKMTALPSEPRTIFQRETQLGAWGGSGVGYQLGWLFRLRFGLPEESVMAGIVAEDSALTYLPWFDYESTDQDGDVPRLRWDDPTLQQDQLDGWNLNHLPTEYRIPTRLTLTNLPRAALESAVYGAQRVRALNPITLEALKAELAAGREVAFGVALTRPRACDELPAGDPCFTEQRREEREQFRDGIWRPLPTDWGGHAMLMVGYDDTRRVFIVKNSWGRDDSGRGRPIEADPDRDGFVEMSYDWLPRIYEALTVLETRDPSAWAATNPQVLLGRWQAEFDSFVERADLAVYHLPGAFPATALSGQTDRRLGTLYSDNAGAFRVNGAVTVTPSRRFIDASFGSNAINDRYDATSPGYRIQAHVLGNEPGTMAGWVGDISGSGATPFFASLEGYPAMRAARTGGSTAAEDYLGAWAFSDDTRSGTLLFESFSGRVVSGRYREGSLTVAGVTLTLEAANPCRAALRIPFPSGTKEYSAGLYCLTSSDARRALMAGTSGTGLATRGFYAYRSGKVPVEIEIVSPTDGSSYPRGRTGVPFSARVQGASSVEWTSNLDGVIGTSASFSRFDLSFGTHLVTATARDDEGGMASDNVTVTIVNEPPTVELIEPVNGATFCVSETITFRADGRDLNNWPDYSLPDAAFSWRSSPEGLSGSGKTVTHGFATAGSYLITVRATDDGGLYDEASVTISVVECSNEPPVVAITTPAEDTSTSDPDYAYDGYDSAKGMWYTDVSLAGEAIDPEDGNLTGAALVWTTSRSDLQSALLGTGTTLIARLYSDVCQGVWHEVTLTATDSDGNARSAVRRIFIWTLC